MPGEGAWLAAWLAALVGCAGAPPDPTTAVIVATPSASCADDGFVNPVTLSGASSSARLSLMPGPPEPGAPPLLFRWTLSGDEHAIVAGGLRLAEVVVVVAGDRPLVVELEVDDQLGGVADAIIAVGLTFPTPCGEGCAMNEICADHAEGDFCVPDTTCADDADCAPCLSCDVALGRCRWEPR